MLVDALGKDVVEIGDLIGYEGGDVTGICVAIDKDTRRCAYVTESGQFRYPEYDLVYIVQKQVAVKVEQTAFERLHAGQVVAVNTEVHGWRTHRVLVKTSASALFYAEGMEDPFFWLSASAINNGKVDF